MRLHTPLFLVVLSFFSLGKRTWAAQHETAGFDHRSPRVTLEAVQGYRCELKCALGLGKNLNAGYRSRDGKEAAYILVDGKGVVRRIVLGSFRIRLGEGLIYGSGGRFFYSTAAAKKHARAIRLRPSLSMWNRQVGGAAVFEVKGFDASIALLGSPPASGLLHAPSITLAAVAVDLGKAAVGAGISAQICGNESALPLFRGRLPMLHFFGNCFNDDFRGSAEMDMVGKRFFTLAELGWNSPLTCSLRLFCAPDLKSMGNWIDVLSDSDASIRGVILKIKQPRLYLRPALSCYSTTRFRGTYSVKERSVAAALSGIERGSMRWELRVVATHERRYQYSSSMLGSDVRALDSKEGRFQSLARIKTGELVQIVRSDVIFDMSRKSCDGACLGVELSWSCDAVAASFRLNSYSLVHGRPYVIFRPGIGSYEFFQMVYGNGADLAARITVHLMKGFRLACFYGIPWQKGKRGYVELKWKY